MKALYETPDVERIEFAAMENIADITGGNQTPGGSGSSNESEDPGMGV